MNLENSQSTDVSDRSAPDVSSGDLEGKKESVAYETYRKTVNQAKIAKEKLAEREAELESFRRAEQDREEQKLREQGELKKLLALKEEENSKLKNVNSSMNERWDEAVKFSALREKLPGTIRDEDCYLIIKKNLSDIVIDPETNNVVQESVDAVAEKLIKEKIYLFDVKNTSGLPGQAPKSSSQLTLEQWKQLPIKERRERMGEVHQQFTKK